MDRGAIQGDGEVATAVQCVHERMLRQYSQGVRRAAPANAKLNRGAMACGARARPSSKPTDVSATILPATGPGGWIQRQPAHVPATTSISTGALLIIGNSVAGRWARRSL